MLKLFGKPMKWMTIALLLVVCIFIVYTYSNDKGRILDRMTDSGPYAMGGGRVDSFSGSGAPSIAAAAPAAPSAPSSIQGMPIAMQQAPIMPSAPTMAAEVAPPVQSMDAGNGGFSMQPVANPTDLLPQDSNSQWANLNPLSGSVPVPVDLLQAGYQIGLDTIGQSLKNANYQLRSDPIIEKKDVGPWMQSTIEPDYGRIPLEIGCGGR